MDENYTIQFDRLATQLEDTRTSIGHLRDRLQSFQVRFGIDKAVYNGISVSEMNETQLIGYGMTVSRVIRAMRDAQRADQRTDQRTKQES